MYPFCTPWKHKKTVRGFSGGGERVHWEQMGLVPLLVNRFTRRIQTIFETFVKKLTIHGILEYLIFEKLNIIIATKYLLRYWGNGGKNSSCMVISECDKESKAKTFRFCAYLSCYFCRYYKYQQVLKWTILLESSCRQSTRKRTNWTKLSEICSKLTKKTERRQWRCSGVFIVNFGEISQVVLVFSLLNLSKQVSAGSAFARLSTGKKLLFFFSFESLKLFLKVLSVKTIQ